MPELSLQTQYIRAINNTGETIQQGFITHATESYGIQTIPLKSLSDGAYTDVVAMNTGPSSRDYWWISWTNDGTNWVSWMGTSAIHDHESSGAPGTVALRGLLGNASLAIWFTVDGDSTDQESITNPWS